MSIQALRERKTEIARACNHMLAEKGEQVWSKEDQAAFNLKADEMDRVDDQIKAHERMLDDRAGKVVQKDPKQVESDQRRAVELYLRKNPKEITAEEHAFIRNTMSTTTGSQGGYTVPSLISSDYIDALKDYGGIRRVAGRLVTGNGNDLSYPTTDGTAEVGEIVAQNASATSADPTFGTVPLNTVKFGSKIITIPIELMQDTTIDIIAMVMQRIRDRVGRIQNTKFSIGTGTGEPFGITVAATVGKTGTTGQTTTVIYDDLVDIVDSVDYAYQAEGDLSWMFSQTMRRVVRKIKDSQGRPIWTPSYESGLTSGAPDRLLDFPVNLNNDMPVPAANAVSMSFGQHKKYMVRDAMELQIFRFDDSAYVTKGQVGFLAWARSGGNLLDTSAVKTYKHSAT
jgi:HK97 family phage major capsid protein